MYKRFLKVVSFLLCFALICSIPAYAAEPRASELIVLTSATLSRVSDGQLYIIYFLIRATANMDALGASSVVVQRLSGSTWVPEYTFLVGNNPELQTSGTDFYDLPLKYTPSYPEASYRAVVYFYAKNSLGTSTKTGTTNIV